MHVILFVDYLINEVALVEINEYTYIHVDVQTLGNILTKSFHEQIATKPT